VSRDHTYLLYIAESIGDIEAFVTGGRQTFLTSKLAQAAVLYKLQTLAETTQLLPATLREAHPVVDWPALRGFRNRLVRRTSPE